MSEHKAVARSRKFTRSALTIAMCGGCLAVVLVAGLLGLAPNAPRQSPQRGLPPGPMEEKAQRACLGCHTAGIILQQQLHRSVWIKEVDKMIRWGAPVAPEDRQALIDYFAQHFGPREDDTGTATLPARDGVEKVRAACLGCHDAGIIAQQQLDHRAWTKELEKMIRWSAPVRPEDREVILNYLALHFGPPAEVDKKEEKRR